MKPLEFLSIRTAAAAGFEPQPKSPLERASNPAFQDLSLALAKFEVRGDLDRIADAGLIRITPRRGLVVVPITDSDAVESRLREEITTVVDLTGALAALRIEGPHAATVMRRLTDLDLESLPAAGAVAHVPAIVRGGGEAFELFWPQEYGHYLAHVIADTAEGLE
jgi:heterotetrameric sarcosine oxidase gamma subunit